MGFVPFTVEGGGFLRYDLPFLAAKVELRRGLGGSNGLVFDALLDGKVRLGDSVFLSGGPRLSVTDATFNQAYFGIDATQSFNSGYAQYYPGAGLRSYGAGASALWRVTDKLNFVAFGAYNRLADVAANLAARERAGGFAQPVRGGCRPLVALRLVADGYSAACRLASANRS